MLDYPTEKLQVYGTLGDVYCSLVSGAILFSISGMEALYQILANLFQNKMLCWNEITSPLEQIQVRPYYSSWEMTQNPQ